MKTINAIAIRTFTVMLFLTIGYVQADDQLIYRIAAQPACTDGNGTYDCDASSPAAACALYSGRQDAQSDAEIKLGAQLDGAMSCKYEFCSFSDPDSSCNADQYSYGTSVQVIQELPLYHTHDEEQDNCEAQMGVQYESTFSASTFPPSTMCEGGCAAVVVDGGCLGDWCAGTYEISGMSCSAQEPPPGPSNPIRSDGTTNTQYENDGVNDTYSEEYDAPPPPPIDADPQTEGVQPPEKTGEVDLPSGSKVTQYNMAGGGSIYVVTDSAGNVTFTDKQPITGTGTYTASVGTVDGGTVDGGTVDGGTVDGGGVDGSGDGGTDSGGTDGGTDSGGTDSGGTDGGSDSGGEEEGEDGTASGGFNCDIAPMCSGKPVECMIVRQAWHQRCETQEIKELFTEEIESSEITDSEGATEIGTQIEGIGDIIGDVDGAEGAGLQDAASIETDVITSRVTGVFGSGTCSLPSMDVEVMGVVMPFGSRLCQHWGIFKNTAAFLVWAFTAITIFMMYANAIRRN